MDGRDVELGFLAQIAESLEELSDALARPRGAGPPILHRNVAVVSAGAGEFVLVPASTRRINVVGIVLMNREAVDVTFLCGPVPFGPFPLAAGSGFEASWGRDVPVLPGMRGEELFVRVSAASTLGGIVAYFED